jgi:hypothetical protein
MSDIADIKADVDAHLCLLLGGNVAAPVVMRLYLGCSDGIVAEL